jgi:hypothetical protein
MFTNWHDVEEHNRTKYARMRAEGLLDEPKPPAPAPQQNRAGLTDAQRARHVEAQIEAALCDFAPEIGKALDDLTDEANAALNDLRGEIEELRTEVAALRADLEILRSVLKEKAGNVEQLVVRKTSHVA